jgi:acetylornithine deacetylase/succinyl-diaminopimelate desuccinylase-like protein
MSQPVKLLRELIALPSVNPAFLPPNDPRAGEHAVAAFLANHAARLGLEVELQPVFPGRANVVARLLPPGEIRRRILLAPHMDTVGEPAMPDSMFRPRLRGGRLHGRGACDTKGCVAAMLAAVGEVARSAWRPGHTEIIFAALVDEENGQAGSRALAQRWLRNGPAPRWSRREMRQRTLAIVGEPTRLRVVTAHKGDLWLKLETRGRAAHGARPELGDNAVRKMARVVELLEGPHAASLRRRRHPLLGHATISVGSIRGGTQPNIVPDRCEISADRRTLPGETEASVRRELAALWRRHRLEVRLVNTKVAPCLPLETDPRLPLVRQFLAAAGQRRPAGVDFFCDASVLSQGGIPSVVFGPGDIAQAHTADEWISVAQLERGAALLARFLRSLP